MTQPTRPPSADGKYLLKCQEEDCAGQKIIDYPFGAGLGLGHTVPMDSSDPQKAMCPLCKKYKLQVISVPTVTVKPVLKGFSRVPTE